MKAGRDEGILVTEKHGMGSDAGRWTLDPAGSGTGAGEMEDWKDGRLRGFEVFALFCGEELRCCRVID
jgi:hypothetical protein